MSMAGYKRNAKRTNKVVRSWSSFEMNAVFKDGTMYGCFSYHVELVLLSKTLQNAELIIAR